ncbi:hypothetical protein BGS_0909 [Beggiatoa sp. SS]|nr:hypothetical protein BGS_0909 [Beggiatoa sp. SS]
MPISVDRKAARFSFPIYFAARLRPDCGPIFVPNLFCGPIAARLECKIYFAFICFQTTEYIKKMKGKACCHLHFANKKNDPPSHARNG